MLPGLARQASSLGRSWLVWSNHLVLKIFLQTQKRPKGEIFQMLLDPVSDLSTVEDVQSKRGPETLHLWHSGCSQKISSLMPRIGVHCRSLTRVLFSSGFSPSLTSAKPQCTVSEIHCRWKCWERRSISSCVSNTGLFPGFQVSRYIQRCIFILQTSQRYFWDLGQRRQLYFNPPWVLLNARQIT